MESCGQPAQSTRNHESGCSQSRAAFARLVEAYQDRLVRYAFRRLGNIEDAEDVVQEVFTRVFPAWARGKRILRLGPYLYRTAANACTDLLRRRKQSRSLTAGDGVEQIAADRPDAAQLAAAAEEVRRIDKLLRRLPARQAEVIRLRVFDDLCFAEIAEVVGCGVATVKSRFRYGIQKLRGVFVREQEVSR